MTLVGHGTVRRQIMGADYKRAATAEEIGVWAELIDEAMRQGAYGCRRILRPNELLQHLEEFDGFGQGHGSFGLASTSPARARATEPWSHTGRHRDRPERESFSQISPVKFAGALAEIDKARMQGARRCSGYGVVDDRQDLPRFSAASLGDVRE